MVPPTASFTSSAGAAVPQVSAAKKQQAFAQRKGNADTASSLAANYDGYLEIKAGGEPREDYDGNVSR